MLPLHRRLYLQSKYILLILSLLELKSIFQIFTALVFKQNYGKFCISKVSYYL